LVVRREKSAETGEVRTVLDWAPWWEGQSQRTKDLVIRARGTQDRAEFQRILGELGITNPAEPEQAQRVALLGLRDRLTGGWVTVSAKPAAPAKALKEIEAEIASLKTHEVAALYDPAGELVFRKRGGADYVKFSPDEVAQFNDAVLTHNHPSGGSFSEADVRMAIRGNLAEIRAVGVNDLGERHNYLLTRAEGGWKVSDGQVKKAVRKADAAVTAGYWEAIWLGKLDRAEAQRSHWHEVMLRVAEELGLDYRRIRLED
jgi:hypothetical protein